MTYRVMLHCMYPQTCHYAWDSYFHHKGTFERHDDAVRALRNDRLDHPASRYYLQKLKDNPMRWVTVQRAI